MGKYVVRETFDGAWWHAIAVKSDQYTAFNDLSYIQLFGDYRLFFVEKGGEIRALFCIFLSSDNKSVVVDEFIIYNSILFIENKTQKKTKLRNEKFSITENVITYLLSNYLSLQFSLSPCFEDMRPFLWHNYFGDLHDRFVLDLKYTSYLDISELSRIDDQDSSKMFSELETIRKRNIRKARSEKAKTIVESNADLFVDCYRVMMEKQGVTIEKDRLEMISRILESTLLSGKAVMFTTYNNNGDIIYLTVFLIDHYRAYYLFGASNYRCDESYRGTICFWDGFNILAKQYGVDVVDLEGVNSPSRGWFKLGFGGSLLPYYKVSIDPSFSCEK